MSDSLEEREDFLEDDPEELYEIINGVKCAKGVPTKEHTALVGEIYKQFAVYL